jgi:DNA (cytosine-5)-methyltransferase 1
MLSSDNMLTINDFSEYLAKNGRPLERKHIDFRRDTLEFKGYERADGKAEEKYRVLNFRKLGNTFYISYDEAKKYLEYLKQMSIDLTYKDVMTVIIKYQDVLQRSRKMGMRGQRNFMGKVEDEVRGKLAEQGCANFCQEVAGIVFEPFYDLLPPGQKRDEGDFTYFKTVDKGIIQLPHGEEIAVKSTNGYFSIAVPETEWNWPGGVYISVRPHLNPNFLLRLINKAIGIEDFSLSGKIGWLEIDGWILKGEMEQMSYIGTRLPGKYHVSETDFRARNYIMHPLQLHRTRVEFKQLLEKYLSLA